MQIVCNITVYVPIPEGESGKSYHARLTHEEVEKLIKENEVHVYDICEFEETDQLTK